MNSGTAGALREWPLSGSGVELLSDRVWAIPDWPLSASASPIANVALWVERRPSAFGKGWRLADVADGLPPFPKRIVRWDAHVFPKPISFGETGET
jgi:hypothetical protein